MLVVFDSARWQPAYDSDSEDALTQVGVGMYVHKADVNSDVAKPQHDKNDGTLMKPDRDGSKSC